MMTLMEAVETVNARREAVLSGNDGVDMGGGLTWQHSHNVDQDKAIFSGYDVDYEELVHVLNAMATTYCGIACNMGLHDTLIAAIAEALHIGLVKGADSRA